MKHYLAIFLAAGTLVGGATAAAAGGDKPGNRAEGASSSTVGSTAPAGQLSLTEAQQRTLWQRIGEDAEEQNKPDNFLGNVGELVPNGLVTIEMPQQVKDELPIVSRYRYAVIDDDKIVLVDPATNRVAGVVRERDK